MLQLTPFVGQLKGQVLDVLEIGGTQTRNTASARIRLTSRKGTNDWNPDSEGEK